MLLRLPVNIFNIFLFFSLFFNLTHVNLNGKRFPLALLAKRKWWRTAPPPTINRPLFGEVIFSKRRVSAVIAVSTLACLAPYVIHSTVWEVAQQTVEMMFM